MSCSLQYYLGGLVVLWGSLNLFDGFSTIDITLV